MAVSALPDLKVLSVDSLRTLILTQYEQLVSAEDKLTTAQEQLLSREREIEPSEAVAGQAASHAVRAEVGNFNQLTAAD